MKFEDLKDSAKPVAELKRTDVQTRLKDCDAVYGIDLKDRRVVQFGKKSAEGGKDLPAGRSMVFTYDRDKGEYELLRSAVTSAFGEHVVMKEDGA